MDLFKVTSYCFSKSHLSCAARLNQQPMSRTQKPQQHTRKPKQVESRIPCLQKMKMSYGPDDISRTQDCKTTKLQCKRLWHIIKQT